MNPGKTGKGGGSTLLPLCPCFFLTEVPSVPSPNMHAFDFHSVITNTGKRLSSDLKPYQHQQVFVSFLFAPLETYR